MSQLISCKACSKEIAKGVKKCPNCGKDQRNWFMRHKIMSFIGFILILGIVGSALGGGDESTAKEDSTSSAAKEERVYAVGDTVLADQLEIVISNVEEKSSVGNEFISNQASDGGIYVAIQYSMKNVSNEPVGMFDYPTINLIDENGTKYSSDIDASGSYAVEVDIDSKVLSDLNPGISVTDSTVYEISQDALSSGKWFIQIDDQKVQIK